MFTIIGGRGFIGKHILELLKQQGRNVWVPTRAEIQNNDLAKRPLGHVIYAVGLTADFRTRLGETVNAHAFLLEKILSNSEWSSWLYLSSTRVYSSSHSEYPVKEEHPIKTSPSADMVYNISKLLGESLCLARAEKTCRVARLSNVFGEGMSQQNFLAAIAHDASVKKIVEIEEGENSSKDYVSVQQASEDLVSIALNGKHRLYNVASGINIKHIELAQIMEREFKAKVYFKPNGTTRSLPVIDSSRLRAEFSSPCIGVHDDLIYFLKKIREKEV